VAAAIAATAAGIFVYNTAIVPMLRYNEAVKLAESGSYNEAIVAFAELGDYKDSDERFWDCKYNYACSLADTGNYDEAIRIFSLLGDYKDCKGQIEKCNIAIYNNALEMIDNGNYHTALELLMKIQDYKDSKQLCTKITDYYMPHDYKNAQVGDVVKLGTYEQDNDLNNKEEIEWVVVDKNDDKLLLLSKNSLDFVRFSGANREWSDSSIKNWLNDDFYNNAFSDDEKELISETLIENTHEYKFGYEYDMIFILSLDESKTYISNYAPPTAYAESKNHFYSDDYIWTRSSGDEYSEIIGYKDRNNNRVFNSQQFLYVRPAMWIDIS